VVETSRIRTLIVDDYGPWRRFARSTLQSQPEVQIVGEASDGLEAVRDAEELQPDLILLDIGLPGLNGIEAARQIRKLSPNSIILFVSQQFSKDFVQAALDAGAAGYVLKADAGSELVRGVQAVLRGKTFVSQSLSGHDLREQKDLHSRAPLAPKNVLIRHEAAFYPDDQAFVAGLARLIKSVLSVGNIAILVATEPHREGILQKLRADAVDVDAAISNGSYIQLDAHETLAKFMVGDMPDANRCAQIVGDLLTSVTKGKNRNHSRVAFCGECAPTLLAQGNVEGAIRVEHLWDEITRNYDADTLCGYLESVVPARQDSPVFQRICAEHSAIHGQELGY